MAPMSRGNSGKAARSAKSKARSKKSGTATQKNHRFESFSSRITRLNIDPLRRNANAKAIASLEGEESQFKASFLEWRDLNMSENFRTFAEELEPLCQSLPQVIHHENEIMDTLLCYMNKRDEVSLEPLLSLISHLAHDLGSRFEVHFQRTVSAVCDIAATHPSVEVIEWSFTCLAYLFKFLSRFLVSDLRPLFGLMAPYLGKTHQKHFIARFAAESMSFLVRKAGARYSDDPKPLDAIIEHAFKDLETTSTADSSQYSEGIAHLFADSMKGIQHGLNASGQSICGALVTHLLHKTHHSEDGSPLVASTTEAIFINVMHHTNEEGFRPAFEATLASFQAFHTPLTVQVAERISRLVNVFVSVRKGSRISSWERMISFLATHLDAYSSFLLDLSLDQLPNVLQATASTLQYVPPSSMQSASQQLLPKVEAESWLGFYLSFAIFFENLGRERFDSLILPGFQRFILNYWPTHEKELSIVLPKLLGPELPSVWRLQAPPDWIKRLEAVIERSTHTPTELQRLNQYLLLMGCLAVERSSKERIARALLTLALQKAQDLKALSVSSTNLFAIGKGLDFALPYLSSQELDRHTVQNLLGAAKEFSRNTACVRSMHKLLTVDDLDLEHDLRDSIVAHLVRNISNPSHELRLESLKCLRALVQPAGNQASLRLLDILLLVENTPFTFDNHRIIAREIRNLLTAFKSGDHEAIIGQIIPLHLLGLLHVPLAPIWDEAAEAVKEIIVDVQSEATLAEEALLWLQADVQAAHIPKVEDLEDDAVMGDVSELECSNLKRLDLVASAAAQTLSALPGQAQRSFELTVTIAPTYSVQCRTQILKILNKVPRLVEKRSRLFVPTFLGGLRREEDEDSDDTEDTLELPQDSAHRARARRTWTVQDKRSALAIFGHFVNPVVVYRTEDVYDCLLQMMANGDVSIQRNALKALMKWRPGATEKYRENLLNLLDEARFREELTVFLGLDRNEQKVEMQHRPDLMPILLRLLYGRIISRSGNANIRRSQASRRKAVLVAVARLGKFELQQFIHILLHPLDALDIPEHSTPSAHVFSTDLVTPRKQLAVLRMIHDVLETLPNYVHPFAKKLMDVIVYCGIRASKKTEEVEVSGPLDSLVKGVRQESLGCLTQMFVATKHESWHSYVKIILDSLIRPRLQNLPVETAQGISGPLRLFAAWAALPEMQLHLIIDEPGLLGKVTQCLVVPSAKDEVKTFILEEILQKLYASFAENQIESNWTHECTERLSEIIAPEVIDCTTKLIVSQPEQRCLHASVQTLLLVGTASGSQSVQEILLPALALLLRQPSKNVGLSLKSDILRLLAKLLPSINFLEGSAVFSEIWSTLSTMFSYVNRASDRLLLVDALGILASSKSSLQSAVDLSRKLNAVSTSRVTEPDFAQRQEALDSITDFARPPYPAQVWETVLHNLLYSIKDNDELAIRSGSSFSIQRFIEEATEDGAADDVSHFIGALLVPALQRGMSDQSELVKSEYLAIVSKLAARSASGFADLKTLLGSDEESSFFNNILHIQQHRRVRALHRLAAQADTLSSQNISKLFMPLIESFYKTDDADASLSVEAIKTIGALCIGLDWQSYRSLAQSLVGSKATYQSKPSIRALGAVTQALYSTCSDAEKRPCTLSRSLPQKPALHRWIVSNLLPRVLEFVHYKDESTVDLRVMVALIAVKLIMILPEDEIARLLPPVLLDMTNVLRSKAQEARDAVRKTLSEIAAFIGPEYFGFILKQLRTALQRGAHLHVLSFTVHSLIVQIHDAVESKDPLASRFNYGDIDYCTQDVMKIVIEDVFGNVGAEKDAEGYTSKMAEVRKKNLSHDTLEKLSKITSATQAPLILNHVWEQLDKLRPRLDKIEELLQRLQRGWRENPDASTIKWLGFCHRVLTSAFEKASPEKDLSSPLVVKMASFSLEVLRRTLDKHEELKTVENLTGFMTMIRDALWSRNDEVQASAMRFLSSIIKVPLRQLDEQADDYVRLVKRAVEQSPTVNAPLPQAALRLLAAVLRERPNAQIKASRFEGHIAYVLGRMKPDLHEPARSGERDRQVGAFNLLRAVLDRGVLVKEVYDIMDVVREVMITTSEHPIPRLSRSVYSRFILDYFPTGDKGFQKQLDFLISNLQYPTPNGRIAVMEVLVFVLNKLSAEQLQTMSVDLFLPLVVILGADESVDCQASARVLLQRILEKADTETRKACQSQMLKWIDSNAEPLWNKIGFQYASIYLTVHADAQRDAARITTQACRIVEKYATSKKRDILDLLEATLNVLKGICQIFPGTIFTETYNDAWLVISTLVQSKSDKIKRLAAQLFETFLGHLVKAVTQGGKNLEMPLTNSSGLVFDKQDAVRAIEAHTHSLRATIETDISQLLTANLAFIARTAANAGTQDILDALLSNTATAVRMTPESSSMKPQLAALRLLHKLCDSVPLAGLLPSLNTVLLSLNNLTDPAIPKPTAVEQSEDDIPGELTTMAQESLEILRVKLGPTEFVAHLSKVQKEVKERRDERRAKRQIDAVSHPERAEKVKQRKHMATKAKRKEKNAKAAGMRRGW